MLVSSASAAPRAPGRGGDPTLASSSSTSEEEFLQVLGEMNRICGEDGNDQAGELLADDGHQKGFDHAGDLSHCSPAPFEPESLLTTSPLEPLFGSDDHGEAGAAPEDIFGMGFHRPPSPPPSFTSQSPPTKGNVGKAPASTPVQDVHHGDPLTPPPSSASVASSTASVRSDGSPDLASSSSPRLVRALTHRTTTASGSFRTTTTTVATPRSRHGSGASCVSFDSAIGDVYNDLTPPRLPSFEFDQELLKGKYPEDATATVATNGSESSRKRVKQNSKQTTATTALYHHQMKKPKLSVAERPPETTTRARRAQQPPEQLQQRNQVLAPASQAVHGKGHHPGPLAAYPPSYPAYPSANNVSGFPTTSSGFCWSPGCTCPAARARWQASAAAAVNYRLHGPPSSLLYRQEVEMVCVDLHRRFQTTLRAQPRQAARSWAGAAGAGSDDPLYITVRLLSDALARLHSFLMGLDPTRWLPPADRHRLYAAHACTLAILRAAASSSDLSVLPAAYPLPYGESLGDVEALQLVLAHDLYNELKGLVMQLQATPGLRELPVALLVMMTAFFTPVAGLQQPDRVVRVHDYFAHKLQLYLNVRYGNGRDSHGSTTSAASSGDLLAQVVRGVDRARSFSGRLREFLADVTSAGLQAQYESVCENIGLIGFLLQTEPPVEAPGQR